MSTTYDPVSQSAALREIDPPTPEQAARQLFCKTSLSTRKRRCGITAAHVDDLRRAYLAGVTARGDALGAAFWDWAERFSIHAPTLASSYREDEVRAFGWGWADAEHGRFSTALMDPRPCTMYRA